MDELGTTRRHQAQGEGRRVAWPRLGLATAVAALIAVVAAGRSRHECVH